MRVPDIAMASEAIQGLLLLVDGKHLMDCVLMAVQTCILRHLPVARLDLNWLVIVIQGEGERVKKSVVSLGHPLANGVVRKMTIVTNRHSGVAAVLPGIVVVLHDVAVRTGLWIVAQVAGSFCITKGEDTQAGQHAQHNG